MVGWKAEMLKEPSTVGQGFLSAGSSVLLPEEIPDGAWDVASDDGSWEAAPNLRVLTGAAGKAALRRAEPVKSAVIVEHEAAVSTLSALRVQVERSAATFGLSSATADAAVATAEPDSESSPSAVKALRALETALARAAAAGVSGLAVHRAQSQRALMSGAAEALRREEDALSWIRESIQAGRA